MTWKLMGLTETQQIGRIVVHPTNPNIVYVAALGHAWGANPERGLYQTTDGGATWTEVKGGGFPETMKGRIGIAIAASNPQVVYALVEADTAKGMKERPSGLYRSNDGGATWQKMNNNDVRPFYYSQVRVDPKNPDRVYWSSTPLNYSDDGGKTVRNAAGAVHVDDHAMWVDPNDAAHFVIGNDGGIAQTWDKGGNYDVLNVFAIGQFYDVSYDFAVPYRVCGGLQDNGSWCGPSRRRSGPITNAMWFNVGGGDGFYTQQDPTVPSTPEQRQRLSDLRTRQRADSADQALRFNWNTPFFLSPHSPTTLYVGANKVLKSTDRGEHLYSISPDLSTRDTMR